MTYCNIPLTTAGPYNQTLFLGCSVVNFNCNLGWGGDQSSLNITLAHDPCYHPQSATAGSVDNAINNWAQQPDNVAGGTAFNKQNDGNYTTEDPTKALHKSLIFAMKAQEDGRDTENISLSPEWKDNGKVCYGFDGNYAFWQGPDIGFLPSTGSLNTFNKKGYEIIGTPVRFKFKNFSFGGIVSSWKENSSQGGILTYDVELKSFSNLLKGCELIIDQYAGTVCGIWPNTNNNPTTKNLAGPIAYNVDGSTTPPTFHYYPYNATITQGNIPNVFNIYGYLEYQGYKNKIYGNARVNENGMSAQFIYDTLVNILGPNSNSNPDCISPFSPYGAIVCRTIRENDTSSDIDPLAASVGGLGASLNLTHMGICPNTIAYDGKRRCLLKIDISDVPRPPKWVRIPGPNISILDFITEICDGAGFDFIVDFLFPTTSQLQNGICGIIKIRTVSRRTQPKKNQIQALVNYYKTQCGVNSANQGKEYSDSNTRTMYIGGKQKRLLQVKNTRLAYKQNTMIYDPFANAGGGSFISYDSSAFLSFATPNQIRQPNLYSIRSYTFKYKNGAAVFSSSDDFNNPAYFATAGTSNVIKKGNYYLAGNVANNGILFEGSAPFNIGANVPLFEDQISPYFGVGWNNLIRPVFLDKNMGQLQILFGIADIQELCSLPLNKFTPYASWIDSLFGGTWGPSWAAKFNPYGRGDSTDTESTSPYFVVLENEIRAAMTGFSEWMSYVFDTNNLIFTTDISEVLYKAFRTKYGIGKTGSYNYYIRSLGDIIALGSRRDMNGRPLQVNLDGFAPETKILYNDLKNIHRFFQDIGNQYYGKQFMIKIPDMGWYKDYQTATNNDGSFIVLGQDENGNDIYAIEGSGKVYTNYEISTDGAWEEPGNWIDDTMIIGGFNWSHFADESGKTPALLGYNASVEKNHSKRFKKLLYKNTYVGNPWTTPDSRFCESNWWAQIGADLSDPSQNANHESNFYLSINHKLSSEESKLIEYPSAQLNIPDAYGATVPQTLNSDDNTGTQGRYKFYVKATADQDIHFLMANDGKPRAILKISNGVNIGSNINPTDNNLSAVIAMDSFARVFKGVSIPQGMSKPVNSPFAILPGRTSEQTVNNGLKLRSILRLAHMYNPYNFRGYILGLANHMDAALTSSPSSYDDDNNFTQKAATPLFCALPLQINTHVYGPWINHPGLIATDIFPDYGKNIAEQEVENLIGGVKVQVDENLVPWNFGGMNALDDYVMTKITEDVNYQQTLEAGSVQIPGFDNFQIGDMIQYYGAVFNGPIVSSIVVQIAEGGGITTTYNFRTYQRKLGLFNKENAERIKQLNQETIKRRKEFNSKLNNLTDKMKAMGGGTIRFM